MSFKRVSSLLVVVCMLAGLLAACGDSTATSVPGTTTVAATTTSSATTTAAATTAAALKGGTFRWVRASEPRVLDPAFVNVSDTIAMSITGNLFEGLLELSPKQEIIPAAAEALPTVSPDGLTYTFKLKKDLKFSNGDAITSQDFLYSWNRIAQIGPAALSGSLFRLVDGFNTVYQEKDEAKRVTLTVSGITAPDEYTVSVKLVQPVSYFLSQVTLAGFWPVSKKAVESAGGKLDPKNTWSSEAATFVGNGPFMVKEWKHGASLRLEPNPYFAGNPKPSINAVAISFISDSTTAKLKYDNNELDDVGAPVADAQTIKSDPKYKDAFKEIATARTTWLSFNISKENVLSKNLKLRQAIAYVIDRQLITEGALRGAATPATVLLPKGFPGYKELNSYPQNLDKAKQLLKEAGYDTPDKVKALSDEINNWGGANSGGLSYPGERGAQATYFDEIKKELQEALGLDIKLNPVPTLAEFTKRRDVDKEFIFYRGNWDAQYPDPQNFYETAFLSTSASNSGGYNNSSFDALVKKANLSTSLAERTDLYAQAEQLLQTDVAYVPLFNVIEMRLVRPTIVNWSYTVLGPQKLKYMQIKQ